MQQNIFGEWEIIEMKEDDVFPNEEVNSPTHYTHGGIETIDYIESKGLNYHLGNVVKYVSRCGHKSGTDPLKDLRKAKWYLEREIVRRESNL
jgi:hypothetical protein